MVQKVAIFCGGPSSEHEVSILSARKIYEFIDKEKYDIYFFFISKDLKVTLEAATSNFPFKMVEGTSLKDGLQKIKDKNMFALLAGIHGEFAEDGKLQAILEENMIPYSGSNSQVSDLCMDKFKRKNKTKKLGIGLPKTVALTFPKDINKKIDIAFPVIVKPNNLGSSVGVSVVENKEQLQKTFKELINLLNASKVLVQELIHGIELSCGCLEKKDGDFIKLPPIEIHPKHGELFDYKSKYVPGESNDVTPPKNISKMLSDEISDIAVDIHKALGCKTYSRSDFLVKDNNIYYLETNTLPGMTSTSLLPLEAQAIDISFTQLLDFIITNS